MKRITFYLIAIVVLVVTALSSCDKENKNGKKPDSVTEAGKDVFVFDTKTGDANIESVSPDGTVVFTGLPEERKPAVGDIIASEPTKNAPYGFLYRVTSVKTSGGKTTVTTSQASIDEAVRSAHVSETINLNDYVIGVENSGGNTIDLLSSPPVREEKQTDTISTAKASADMDISIKISATVPLEEGLSAKLEGTTKIKLTANFDIDIDDWSLQYMKFTISPEITSKVTLGFEGKIKAEKRINVAKVLFSPITIPAGPVPIIIVPEVSIDIVIGIEGTAKLVATLIDANYKFVYGVEYKNGEYHAINENLSQPTKYLDNVLLLLSGEARLQPQLSIAMMLYGVAGVSVVGGLPAKLTVDDIKIGPAVIYGFEEVNPKMKLTLALAFGLELKLEILSKILAEWKTQFDAHTWDIWERKVFPEFEAVAFSNQTTSSLDMAATVKGFDFIFPVEQYGFCWSTAPMPTTNNDKKEFGKLEFGSSNSIQMMTNVSGLDDKTTYRVRPFFQNMFGTFYGQETSFALGAPAITLSPSALSFGDVPTGTSVSQSIRVSNTGGTPLEISSITSSDPAFTMDWTTAVIPKDDSKILHVTFSPTQEKDYNSTLAIHNNSAEKNKTAALSGAGTVEPLISVSYTAADFATVTAGTTASFTINNEGEKSLTVTSIIAPAGCTLSYTQGTIAVGASQTVTATFSAAVTSGSISIISNASNGTLIITVGKKDDDPNGVTINGVKWATHNVGTTPHTFTENSEDFGGYYTWNEAQSACPSGWRVPTSGEIQSLISSGSIWTTVNYVYGLRFGIGGGSSNTIFLPSAGTFLNGAPWGGYGTYWGSTQVIHSNPMYNPSYCILGFNSGGAVLSDYYYIYSMSVRCVANN